MEFIEKFPARFMMEDGFETPEEAAKFWKRRFARTPEPLYFVTDTMYHRTVCMDLKGAAEQRASMYEALASALGQV